jgi:hypothetical protein
MRRSDRCVQCLAFVLTVASPALWAQEVRDSLVDRALSEFDANRQIQLLVTAVNPSLGPVKGSWSVGVQLLAQTLIDQRRDSVAAVWLRWAIRLSPELQPDTVEFLPRMTSALRRARDFVNRSESAGDTATVTTWVWPSQWTDEAKGWMRFAPAEAAPLHISVDAVGLDSETTLHLPVGSHEVWAAAVGYDSAHVTREVLPGVTTVLQFHLHEMPIRVALPQPPSGTSAQAPVVSRGKRFPWLWAALGAAGAGTAAFFLLRQPTGSISVTIPNPR